MTCSAMHRERKKPQLEPLPLLLPSKEDPRQVLICKLQQKYKESITCSVHNPITGTVSDITQSSQYV